jgi:hypothetical protein
MYYTFTAPQGGYFLKFVSTSLSRQYVRLVEATKQYDHHPIFIEQNGTFALTLVIILNFL